MLSNNFQERTREQIEKLQNILYHKMPDFAKFSLNERVTFCKVMSFDTYPKNTLMIKEGHIGTCFYFVFSGQVEVFKLSDGWKHRVLFF